MRKAARGLTRRLILLAGLITVAGCALPKMGTPVQTDQTKYYTNILVYSDPPGAHVYYSNGDYWGQTDENKPVSWVVWNYPGGGRRVFVALTLKKRGYKPTHYAINDLSLDYTSQAEAEQHPKKIVVVLDTE